MSDVHSMSDVHFETLDLNLLRVLGILLEERSVTRAAERLGLTQSAVSHALNRLRYALRDELFVRGPNGLHPTPRAIDIAPRLRRGLVQLRLALAPAAFVPAESDRQFVMACNDHVAAALLPDLVARLRALAPGAGLRVWPADAGLADVLESGRIDLAIGSFGRIPERFASELLYRETMVWALSADHPMAREPLTLERLAALPHLILAVNGEDGRAVDGIVVEHGLEWRVMCDDAGAFEEMLAAHGLRRRIALTIPHALAAPRIVARSDMAALLPRRLALAYADRYHLRLFEPPYASPPIDIRGLWRANQSQDPGLRWLVGLLRDVADARERSGPCARVAITPSPARS
jgi:DNA-binding transcriptional LysR family regulator